jgi:hypothetical protein
VNEIANCRRHNTYETAQPAKTAKLAVFATKMRQTFPAAGHGLIVWDQPESLFEGIFLII